MIWKKINPKYSLLARIFVYFWVILIATLLSIYLLLNLASNGLSEQHKKEQMQAIKTLRNDIVDALESGDRETAIELLGAAKPHLRDQFRIYDDLDFELLDRYDEAQTSILRPMLKSPPPIFHSQVVDEWGAAYDIYVRLRPRLNIFESHHPTGLFLRLACSLLVSFVGCYLLALSLTRRIHILQQRAHQVVERINSKTMHLEPLPELYYGADELGQLGHDIDYMRQQLQRDFEKKQQLLRDIAHDLRAPLSRQSIALEMLSLDNPDNFSILQSQLERDHEQLTHLLTQTLAWLRHGDEDLNKTQLPLNQIIEEIVHDAMFEFSHIQFSLSADNKIFYRGNEQLLASALENIIRNAGHFAYKSVTVFLFENESHITISVKDDGGGVPDTSLTQIFEPFAQVDNARTPSPQKGFGLGLAIAKQAIERHQGRLVARNNAGLEVEIILPL